MKPRKNKSSNPDSFGTLKPLSLVIILTVSLSAGAASWALTSLNIFNSMPKDSGVALALNQLLLCSTSFMVAKKAGFLMMLTSVFHLYVGQNIYLSFVGGMEHSIHVLLGLAYTASLCILPLLVGMTGALFHLIKSHHILLITRKERLT